MVLARTFGSCPAVGSGAARWCPWLFFLNPYHKEMSLNFRSRSLAPWGPVVSRCVPSRNFLQFPSVFKIVFKFPSKFPSHFLYMFLQHFIQVSFQLSFHFPLHVLLIFLQLSFTISFKMFFTVSFTFSLKVPFNCH